MGVGVGRQGRGALIPLDFTIITKKWLFFQFRGVKNKFHHFWPLLEKFWENLLLSPRGKNPSDAHGAGQIVGIAVCTRGFLVVAQSRRVYWLGVFFFGWSTWNWCISVSHQCVPTVVLFSCVACASRVAASTVTLSICFLSFSTVIWGKPVLLTEWILLLRFRSVGWLFCHTLKPLVIFVQIIYLKRQSRLW